jgi:hypothetical protein
LLIAAHDEHRTRSKPMRPPRHSNPLAIVVVGLGLATALLLPRALCACITPEGVYDGVFETTLDRPLTDQRASILSKLPLGTPKERVRQFCDGFLSPSSDEIACSAASEAHFACTFRTDASFFNVHERGMRLEFRFRGGALEDVQVDRTRTLFGFAL